MTTWYPGGVDGIGVIKANLDLRVVHCRIKDLEDESLQFVNSDRTPGHFAISLDGVDALWMKEEEYLLRVSDYESGGRSVIFRNEAFAFRMEKKENLWQVSKINLLHTGDVVGISKHDQYEVEYVEHATGCDWKFHAMKWIEQPGSSDSTDMLVRAYH